MTMMATMMVNMTLLLLSTKDIDVMTMMATMMVKMKLLLLLQMMMRMPREALICPCCNNTLVAYHSLQATIRS